MVETLFSMEDDPLWYKDAIIYELPVRAFYDSNNDGIGDFPGLTEKLDYLKELGIRAMWLLPFYPSPLKDDGYDISDYMGIHPDYGTLKDFRQFLKEAHRRGIRVITELVLNHTSDQHPWFKTSRRSKPGSLMREFYIWSDTAERYKDARVIFKDFETSNWAWDPVAKAYYFHRFYSHQPDLNFDNPHVRKTIYRVIDYWLEMGVDGLRLDAVPYLFKREHTNCENLPETYAFLREMRAHVDSSFKNRMLLAEANQWPEDAAAYFGNGDMCHMAYHFPLMPRIFIGLQMEDRFPIVDMIEQTPPIPGSCQWALFLRNHDELTLEMVTDEERDYMYRVYAGDPHARLNLGIRRRLSPLMEGNRRKIELMKVLLFSLPGTPVIYYGDEIGMGDNYYLGDRNGVRTPMQWSPDRNAGFSKTNPQRLYLPVIIDPEYHFEAVNVENQERNPSSFLWWMKRLIAGRRRFRSLGRGTLEFLLPDNPKILAFIRKYGEETILVVMNLSRFFQVVELDLSNYAKCIPEEPSSQGKFPMIGESPYVLTLGPYDYLPLLLKKEEEPTDTRQERTVPEVRVKGNWEAFLEEGTREIFEERILPLYLENCRWFGGKAKRVRSLHIVETIPVGKRPNLSYILLLEVSYTEGMKDVYLLPISFSFTRKGEAPSETHTTESQHPESDEERMTPNTRLIPEKLPEDAIARLQVDKDEGVLYDGVYDSGFRDILFGLLAQRERVRGEWGGELVGIQGRMFRRSASGLALALHSQPLKADQSNTSILYEDKFYLKLYRSLKEGVNPDREMTQFLTERAGFPSTPPYAGCIEYRRAGSEPILVGLLQSFVANQGDAWTYTQDVLGRYFEKALSRLKEAEKFEELTEGHYLEMVLLLGKRTAEMHLALASFLEEKDFAPEPYSLLDQRSLYESMRTLLRRVLLALRKSIGNLSSSLQEEAALILSSESKILSSFRSVLKRRFSALRIRIHGDYHLGQVLYTGKDFIIIDFEGEPVRQIAERRRKRSPLQDVAGMMRSFHYAAYSALLRATSIRPEDVPLLKPWADHWHQSMSSLFLKGYMDAAGEAPFIPREREEIELLLKVFLLEKAIYELGYELDHRPQWVIVPMQGIRDLMEGK